MADQYILLPDGTWALVHRGIDWGELAILIILVALLFLKLYELWMAHPRS